MTTSIWKHLQKYSQDTRRLLGIDGEKLQDLILLCRDRHHQKKLENEKQKVRLIKKGGGKPPKREIEEQIILTLFYLRQGVTFRTLALHFNASESTAHNYFCYWQSILEEV